MHRFLLSLVVLISVLIHLSCCLTLNLREWKLKKMDFVWWVVTTTHTHYKPVLFSCEIMRFMNKSKLTLKVFSKCDGRVICTYFNLKGWFFFNIFKLIWLDLTLICGSFTGFCLKVSHKINVSSLFSQLVLSQVQILLAHWCLTCFGLLLHQKNI